MAGFDINIASDGMGNQPGEQEKCVINHSVLRNSQICLKQQKLKTLIPVLEEEGIGEWVVFTHKVKQFGSPFLFNPQSYSVQTRQMCGNACTIKIVFPLFPYVLMDEIMNRRQIKNVFEENELWYILYGLCESSNHFLGLEGDMGDIRPHNILFNETGDIKIIHRFSWPGELSNFEKTRFQNRITFLSPEEIDQISSGKTYNTADQTKAESFSIGLTILSAICLRDFSDLYEPNFMTMDVEDLRSALRLIEDSKQGSGSAQKTVYSYSTQLITIVQRLCDPDPLRRLTSIEVFRWLLPYEREIINFQAFQLRVNNGFSLSKPSHSKKFQKDYASSISETPSVLKKSSTPNSFKIVAPAFKLHRQISNTFTQVPNMQLEDLSPSPANPVNQNRASSEHQDSVSESKPIPSIAKIFQQKNATEFFSKAASVLSRTSNNGVQDEKFFRIAPVGMAAQDEKGKILADLNALSVTSSPVEGGQEGAREGGRGLGNGGGEDDELLRRIESQLAKSRQMFPS